MLVAVFAAIATAVYVVDPRSIALPLAPIMRAFVIVRSCAPSDASVPKVTQASINEVSRFISVTESIQFTRARSRSHF